ncbi:MAG: MarR family winged helix-turn-helix transcriptional regulator [Marmoricola sp.]
MDRAAASRTGRAGAISALEQELGVLIRRVRRAQGVRARMMHPELSSTGYQILRFLQESGVQRSSTLADTFAIDKGAVSRQISHLEELGFVVRDPDPEDGRAQLLRLTEEASRRLVEVDVGRRQRYDERLSGWDAEAISGLAKILAEYNASLD